MRLISPLFLTGLAATLVAVPAHAQSAITLGERPIARAEVSAFVKKQLGQMDSSRDNQVSPREFEAFRARQSGAARTGLAHIGRRWFEKTDANGDGKVTLAEAIARPLQMFDVADVNRDGVASVREQSFAQLLIGR